MALITNSDFNEILTKHGRNIQLRQIDERPDDTTTHSAFDMIYGYVDDSGDSGEPAYITRTFLGLIQEVQTGQEEWITKVGTLEVGDAVLYCKPQYTDDNGAFIIEGSQEVVDTVSGKIYTTETPANNIDGTENIFKQVILKKKV